MKNLRNSLKTIPLPKLHLKAQMVFNKWIRERDKNLGCISCNGEVQHAGHYFSQGHFSSLRYNEENVNGQCLRCNNFLHGNLIRYRQGLVDKIGEDNVRMLEAFSRHAVKKWSRSELEEIISRYKI